MQGQQIDEIGIVLIGPSMFADEHPTWIHLCRETRWAYAATPDHVVVQAEPLTLAGSLLCPDCGLHGWVENGAWRSA